MNFYNRILNEVMIPALGNESTFDDDLNKAGKKLFGNKFLGVFSRDEIPKLSKQTPYAIINLDKSTEGGSHWIGIAWMDEKKVMVYDSFGLSKKSKKLAKSLGKPVAGSGILKEIKFLYPNAIMTDPDFEQLDIQETCGPRVLVWLVVFDNWGSEVAQSI